MNRLFTGFYHLLWYAFAVVLIMAAIIVTAARLALPGIGNYKTEIQSWVSEYMNYPVMIKEINADWSGWTPNLHLQNIDLYSQDKDHLIARFEHANLGINLIGSIWQREIIPTQLSIEGLTLDLTRQKNGSISVSNQSTRSNRVKNTDTELAEWLLNQRYIILEEASISWKDDKQSLPVRNFESVRLVIKSDNDRRQLDASIKLPGEFGETLSVNVDMNGNPLEPNWDAEIYIDADRIIGDELLQTLPVNTRGGAADIRLWTRWKNTKLTEVYGDISYDDFMLIAKEHELAFKSIKIQFSAERQKGKDWLFNIATANLETENGLWPAATHQVLLSSTNDNYQYSGQFSFLRIEEILPFLIAGELVTDKWLQYMHWPSVQGDLKNLEFSGKLTDADSLRLRADFNNLAMTSIDNTNRFTGLDGVIAIDNLQVHVQLESDSTEVRLGTLFKDSMMLSDISADLTLDLIDVPELKIDSLSLSSNDMPIELSGDIIFNSPSPFINLIGRIGTSDLDRLPKYLPRQAAPLLHEWFKQAFVGGTILSGDLLFHGTLNQYPFNNDEGIFKAYLNLSDATLNYQEGWPFVDRLTAEVLINNDDLSISSSSGYVFDASIDELTARIDNLVQGSHHIIIDGKLSGQTGNALLFINQSPLKANEALYKFAKMNMAGSFSLDLQLDIPLYKAKSLVNGNITLEDTMLESDIPGLGLENINGNIKFNRDKTWSSGITAVYHDNPVELSIPLDQENTDTSKFIISGEADKVFIIQELGLFFPALLNQPHNYFDYFNGKSRWAVTIEHGRNKQDAQFRNILIESSLQGIEIKLPAPIGKTISELRPLKITTQLVDARLEKIGVNYDNNIQGNILVDNSQDFKIDQIQISAGKNAIPDDVASDVVISGQLEELNLDNWLKFFNSDHDRNTASSRSPDKKSISVDLNLKQLILLNQSYADTQFTLSSEQDIWLTGFDGAEIKGQASLSNTTSSQADKLDADFDILILKESETAKKDEKYDIDLNKVPALNVHIRDFTYNNKNLGEALLKTTKQKDLINIDSLTFSKPDVNISATGEWKLVNGVDNSALDFSIEAESMTGLLTTFSHTGANIDGGKTNIQLSASWPDSPVNFKIDDVSGEMKINIDKGQLLDVEPSAARLMGLLSITTLPRRLSLDFSDLFEQGFAFDRIEGSFNLQDGQAYTNDLLMTAPAADIVVSGRTGLVSKDYDQLATVMPKITSSLPVGGAIFGPIGIGVGTAIFLAGELFESIPKQINKILSYQYSIRGSWDNPVIKEIGKDNPIDNQGRAKE